MIAPDSTFLANDDTGRKRSASDVGVAELQAQVELLAAENRRLQVALELRERALNAMDSGFLIIDTQERHRPIVFANRSMEMQTGYSQSELIGIPAEILNVRDADLDNLRGVRDAMRAGREHRTELRCRRTDGT